ncbi:MAG: hypothetical protein JXR84_15270 [Anaerolineae bacterium]|nr:hypothetical protein [Anaerolineae bacterium]
MTGPLPPREYFTVQCSDVVRLSFEVCRGLPAAAVGIWLVIRMYCWQNPPEFVEIPDERFHELLGYSRQYVYKMLKTIEECGLIERRGRRTMRIIESKLSEDERKQLFTSTNVYVNNQHEEEDFHSLSSSCNPVREQAQTSTNDDVVETNGDVATNDDVLSRVMTLFEQEIGGTVTLMVAEEMRELTRENRDVAMWEATFRASVGKHSRWAWIKAVISNGGLKREQKHDRSRRNGGKDSGAPADAAAEQRRRDVEAAERLRRRGVGV